MTLNAGKACRDSGSGDRSPEAMDMSEMFSHEDGLVSDVWILGWGCDSLTFGFKMFDVFRDVTTVPHSFKTAAIYLFTSDLLSRRGRFLQALQIRRQRQTSPNPVVIHFGNILVMKNRKPDERRSSARFNPAAAEPLLVIDSPPHRQRSNSRLAPSLPSACGSGTPTNTTAAISPTPDDVLDAEASVKSRKPASRHRSNSSDDDDAGSDEKLGLIASLRSYPKGVFFMLGNEFCERFSFYGMRAVLMMYFIHQHQFEASTAKMFFHGFVSIAYLTPLLGSIAADNYFGRFKVILWVSLLYVLGHALLSVGALPYFAYSIQTTLDFSGLLIIALATGGIKPCVSAFAADQFEPNQHRQRAQFFSFFYFAINGGSLVAIMLTPLLRGRVSCFGSPYCFPLAFGVPGVLMLLAFILFLSGWRFYKITPAKKGNVVFKVVKCIGVAMKGKFGALCKREDKKPHWVDYASPKYSDSLIAGVKSLLAVSLLFVPFIFFWALFDQQGSTWVLQASQMDGRVGPFTILPDQMNTLNPLIVLIMVPIFEAFIYPLTAKFVEITPLRKMGVGGLLAAFSFVMAGCLQLKVNATLETLPSSGNVFVQTFGSVETTLGGIVLPPGEKTEVPIGEHNLVFGDKNEAFNTTGSAFALGVFGSPPTIVSFPYSLDKAANGETRLILLVPDSAGLGDSSVVVQDSKGKVSVSGEAKSETVLNIKPGIYSSNEYTIRWGKGCESATVDECEGKKSFLAHSGAVHIAYLEEDAIEVRNVVRANGVSVLWQIPQFFVITLGEVLLSVTGLEFSYSQASPNMKSVLQAMWLLTTFAGNMIDMGISGLKPFTNAAFEFFFYALLMFVVIGVFILISLRYNYVDEEALESQVDEDEAKEDPDENEKAHDSEKAAITEHDSTASEKTEKKKIESPS
uniref:MFS domain-containing protein n=1 Tax=Panagrellus redivivus TaxID=6233 RepID=A0A7E4V7L3_PANRE